MLLTRQPRAALRPFIKTVWAVNSQIPPQILQPNLPQSESTARERVLPTGNMHLVFRLSAHPLRLFNNINDPCGHTISRAVVGGTRPRPFAQVPEPTADPESGPPSGGARGQPIPLLSRPAYGQSPLEHCAVMDSGP